MKCIEAVNDFVIKAMAIALQKIPEANVSWTEAAMLRHKHSDIGVAVALPFGLITPIIRQAEIKTLSAISNEMKDLAARAKGKKLKPNEYQGGTSSVSNLGMFNIEHFTAIINPPEAAILAVGGVSDEPVVKGFARAFTGWSFGGLDTTSEHDFHCPDENDEALWQRPMQNWPAFHEPGEKLLLDGRRLPAGQGAAKDLNDALDAIDAVSQAAQRLVSVHRDLRIFVRGDAAHLLATWHESRRPAALEPDPPGLKWLGLEVKKHGQQDADHAWVEFVARCKLGGRAQRLQERSRFVREQGCWWYVDGDVL